MLLDLFVATSSDQIRIKFQWFKSYDNCEKDANNHNIDSKVDSNLSRGATTKNILIVDFSSF